MKLLYLGGIAAPIPLFVSTKSELHDCETELVEDAAGFAEKLNLWKPDVVVVDYRAGLIDDDVLIALIKKEFSKLPFLIITAATQVGFGLAAVEAGAYDYLLSESVPKLPFTIKKALEHYQLRKDHKQTIKVKARAEKRLVQVNRLYQLIRQLNLATLNTKEESDLFSNACRIFTEHGGFKLAMIGLIDQEQRTLKMVVASGVLPEEMALLRVINYQQQGPQQQIISSGNYYVCNDIAQDFPIDYWRDLATERGMGSFIMLPICKGGAVIGTFIIAAADKNFFTSDEIALLDDAVKDISFRLDVFEIDRQKAIADAKLKQNEERLKQAQAVAHLGSWELDFDSGVAEWSEEALRIYGLPVDQTKQSYEAWLSVIHPDDLDYVLQVTGDAREQKAASILDHRILRGDGTVRYLHSEAHFVFDEAGNPKGLHGTALDLTDIRLAEEALRESEARYSTLFHMSPQPGWVYDPETFKIVQVNRAAIRHYGYTEEEFLNMTIWDIRPEEDFASVMDSIRTNQVQKETVHYRKYRHYKKSGELIDVDIYSNSIILNDKPYRLIIAIDVTDRNTYENKMTSAIIQTQEDERYEIGAELHDNVCQILASTLLKLSLMRENLPADTLKRFQEIQNSITLVTKEIRNISHRLAPASFDDSTLEESLRLLIRTYNIGRKQNIILQYDSRLNAYPLSHGIKLNLYRIIQEQLSNIFKHAAATEIIIKVVIERSTLKLSITDNGKGCELPQTKSGIGLANMRRRVQLFSGYLEVASKPGEGYIVKVEIPVKKMLLELAN